MTVEKKISSWFGHPYLNMVESNDENERNELLRLIATDLGLPRPVYASKIEAMYIWQRALVKAGEELSEARASEHRANVMVEFFKTQFEAAGNALGLKVPK